MLSDQRIETKVSIYEQTLDHLTVGVVVIREADRAVVYVNESVFEHTRFTKRDLREIPMDQILPSEIVKPVNDLFNDIASTVGGTRLASGTLLKVPCLSGVTAPQALVDLDWARDAMFGRVAVVTFHWDKL